jgi:hypothetical protein
MMLKIQESPFSVSILPEFATKSQVYCKYRKPEFYTMHSTRKYHLDQSGIEPDFLFKSILTHALFMKRCNEYHAS